MSFILLAANRADRKVPGGASGPGRTGGAFGPMLARGRTTRDDDGMMTPAATTPHERRLTRSDDPRVALEHQLTQTRREGRLDAIVVADDAGLVVAGVGAWAMCEKLAAYAPILVRASAPGATQGSAAESADIAEELRVARLWAEVVVRPVEVEGQTLILCARTAGGEAVHSAALDGAADGVARILARAG